jgi:hypothetical protein
MSFRVRWRSAFLTSCVISGLLGDQNHGVFWWTADDKCLETDLSVFRKVSYLRKPGCFQQYIIPGGVL